MSSIKKCRQLGILFGVEDHLWRCDFPLINDFDVKTHVSLPPLWHLLVGTTLPFWSSRPKRFWKKNQRHNLTSVVDIENTLMAKLWKNLKLFLRNEQCRFLNFKLHLLTKFINLFLPRCGPCAYPINTFILSSNITLQR